MMVVFGSIKTRAKGNHSLCDICSRPALLTERALTQEHLGGDKCVVAEPHRFTGPGPPWGKQRRGQSGAEAGRTVLRLSGKKVESEKIPEWTIRDK